MKNKFEVRDPIHGFIEFNQWEKDIIDHPVFQRLRRIKQLAGTDMVYPSANHNRFSHSLGVMHLATKMFDTVRKKRKDYLINNLNYDDSGIQRDKLILRLSALLHDVGHCPFSHAGEEVMPFKEDSDKRYEHEDYTASAVLYLMKDVIDHHPLNENYKITTAEISNFIKGENLGRILLWRNIITGQLDADRCDYLLRDSYYIGAKYGHFDLERLLCCLTLAENEEKEYVFAVESGGMHAAEALLLARYQMFTQVYFHKTRRAYDIHVKNTLKELLKDEYGEPYFPKPDEKGIKEYLEWDDWKVLGLIKQGKGGEYSKAFVDRKHCKSIYNTAEVPKPEETEKVEEIEGKLKGKIEYFIDTAKGNWHKTGNNDIVILCNEYTGDEYSYPLSVLSSIVNGLVPVYQSRVYVPYDLKEKAKKIIKG